MAATNLAQDTGKTKSNGGTTTSAVAPITGLKVTNPTGTTK